MVTLRKHEKTKEQMYVKKFVRFVIFSFNEQFEKNYTILPGISVHFIPDTKIYLYFLHITKIQPIFNA